MQDRYPNVFRCITNTYLEGVLHLQKATGDLAQRSDSTPPEGFGSQMLQAPRGGKWILRADPAEVVWRRCAFVV